MKWSKMVERLKMVERPRMVERLKMAKNLRVMTMSRELGLMWCRSARTLPTSA